MPIRETLLIALALALAPVLQVQAAPARVSVSAEPRQVELVPGARARLRITASEIPVVSASVGAVEGLKLAAPGVYEGTYFPPRETYPQVAIITALAGRSYGWLALPLAGTGEVSVKAGPDGMASLAIGSTRFGPQRADASGNASIRIVVPPGVRHATAGGKRVNLGTPDVSHVFAVPDHASVTADVTSSVVVRVFAVTAEGKPRRGARLSVAASSGQALGGHEVEPGVTEFRWALAPGPVGPVWLEASLADEPAFTSRATVQRDPSAPRRLRLELPKANAVAGEGPLEFSLAVEDAAGNPVDDASPRASASLGAFLGWTRLGPGHWKGQVAVPERLNGYSKMEIVATAGEVVAQRQVPLVAGPPADLTVDPPAGDLSNRPELTFSVTAVDRFGNPSDSAAPRATALVGQIEGPVRQAAGIYRVTYRPPADRATSSDEIRFQAGSIERLARVRLAAPRSPLLTVTPKVGGAAKSGGFGPAAGGEVAMWTPLGGVDLGLAFEGTWFRFSQRKAITGSTGTVDAAQSYVALTLSPSLRRPLGSRAMLWASAGGGMVNVHSTSTITGGTQPLKLDEAKWVPTGTAAVGVGAKLWGGFPFLELRAAFVADPKLNGLSGSFVPFFLQMGYRFDAF